MGMFYHNGLGVLEDAVEASKWYRLAAEQGDAISQLSWFFMAMDLVWKRIVKKLQSGILKLLAKG